MALSVDLSVTNFILLCAFVFAVKKLRKLYQEWKIEKMLERWKDAPRDKVILHTIWRCRTLPSISPYALKLETYLRMAKIPYELETVDFQGKNGRLPWITYNGTHIADSHLIIKFLNKKFSVNLNKNATEEQIAIARSCRIILENHFFWGIVQYRWIENIANIGQIIKFPGIQKFLAPFIFKRTLKKRMIDQGIGKHTPTEIYQMTEDDLHTISTILANQSFFSGNEQPMEDDACLFAFLSNVVWGMPGSSFERLVHGELRNLKEYCERMKHLYWPDWEQCIDRS